MSDLPDVQITKPEITIPIQQVGVENVEVPFYLQRRNSEEILRLDAKVSMRSDISKDMKGISMSRFLRTLIKHLDKPLKRWVIEGILKELKDKVGSKSTFMKFNFKYPINRQSPISDYSFPVYYDCRFEGQYLESNHYRFFQGFKFQYAAYCPCSAELCHHLSRQGAVGYPHNQRAFADILIESSGEYLWLEDVIDAVENGIRTLPYPIVKRLDEQEIARIAAENPLFVEDAVRIISQRLNQLPVKDWIVKCIHEESIHTSDAIAINWKGVPNGFDGSRFI
jgi:GTP cyclohydrolase I